MSYTLVDHHGVSVGRFAGPRGVPMIQITLAEPQADTAADLVVAPYRTMTLSDFHVWLCDLFGGMFEAAVEAGDPPDPRTLEALERALGIH